MAGVPWFLSCLSWWFVKCEGLGGMGEGGKGSVDGLLGWRM